MIKDIISGTFFFLDQVMVIDLVLVVLSSLQPPHDLIIKYSNKLVDISNCMWYLYILTIHW